MRVFIVLLALAYWGLASLAQSYLANGGSYSPPLSPNAFDRQGPAEAASQSACAQEEANDLLMSASFSAASGEEPSPQRSAAADSLCEE